jgi:DNA-binding NarL/FixJ family response regulator
VRVLIVEDSGLIREGLAALLRTVGAEVVGQLDNPVPLPEAVRKLEPDVVVMDIRMPPTHTTEGLDAAVALREEHPGVAVLLLSQYVETGRTLNLLQAGGRGVGYLLKDRVADVNELHDALRRLLEGGTVVDPSVVSAVLARHGQADALSRLTPRELEILGLMAEGRSNTAIAARLVLSGKTVETHIARLLDKLGLPLAVDDHRRVLAVLTWLRANQPVR